MSSCDVCIGGYDCDGPEFYTAKVVKARKSHKCYECRSEIKSGEQYFRDTGMWGGDFSTFRTCCLCVEIRDAFSCDGTWMYGSLWDDLRECVFPELTTANKCLQKLGVAARQQVIEEWQKWKGLR